MSVSIEEIDHLRIPLKDIVSATSNFAEENLLKRGGKAEVYRGLLLQSEVEIDVVIRKYISSTLTFDFYVEIKRITLAKIGYAVRLIGFCDEEDERMIVMEHLVNGSLDKYLSDPTLTWSQKLLICGDAACGLCSSWIYNFTTCFFPKGFKILLDKDMRAKLLICIDSLSDPKYAFGVILLEVLLGRKATIEDVNQFQSKLAKNRYEKRELSKFSVIDYSSFNIESLYIFSEVVSDCLKGRFDKSQLDRNLRRLDTAYSIQHKHENPLQIDECWHIAEVDHFAYLKIPLSRIKLATKFFSRCIINSSICETVYKAELDYFDRNSVLPLGEDTGVLPNKSVIISRFTEFGKSLTPKEAFFAEINMLIHCKHPNVLSFLGFCDEDSEMILVFEGSFEKAHKEYIFFLGINYRILSRILPIRSAWEHRLSICLDIAHGLKYLHNIEGKPMMIHHVMDSVNVFVDEKFTAKIANFRLSNLDLSSRYRMMSPQRLDRQDTYFLGVILFHILTGKNDELIAQRYFETGELTNIADRMIMEEFQEFQELTKEKGLNQDSLDTIAKIAYQCTQKTPSERPTYEAVIRSLEKALYFQRAMMQMEKLEHLKIPLKDIKLATGNFDINCRIGSGGYGEVYKAKLKLKSKDEHLDTLSTVAIKRIKSRKDDQGNEGFFAELDVVSKCQHPNIVLLLGFCVEDGEMLLVYELASEGSLEEYLENNEMTANLTWAKRLKMCIDIAEGLKYMHTTMENKETIIHGDIKSANILLDRNLEAKITDFGLSRVHHGNRGSSTIETKNVAGTNFYLDPEYVRTGRLKKASDIYSFGVVLFEIFSGKLAYDSYYIKKNERGLAPVARRHFKKGTLREILDPVLMDEAYELGFKGKLEPDHDSLDVFSRIAYECLAKTQVERPTLKDIIEELKKALDFQENRIKTLKFSLKHIRLGVEDFSSDNFIMRGGYGVLYKGKVQYNNRDKQGVVKRFSHDRYLNDTSLSWKNGFLKEFEVLFKYKHENIIGLEGYCKEMDEKIIVYEHVSKGSLDRYLDDSSFSWTKRLKICIDIAKGLKFLHEGDLGQDVVIHRDLKSSNILLNKDYRAKICGFELALTYPANRDIEYVINEVEGSLGYSDPLFRETRFLTKESDIYSFGVILFEILCGRLACPPNFKDPNQFLDVVVKRHFQEAPLMDIVFNGIKEQIGPKSLATFRRIAFQCLLGKRKERPIANDIVVQLQNALKFQEAYERHEAYEIQEAKLHIKDKAMMSKSPETYSTRQKNDISNILSKGILPEDDKLDQTRAFQKTRDHKQYIEEEEEEGNYHSEPIMRTNVKVRKHWRTRKYRGTCHLLHSKRRGKFYFAQSKSTNAAN